MTLPGWRTLALGASLALNLAFVGMLAGVWVKGPPPPPVPGVGPYVRALPEPYRKAVTSALRDDREAFERFRDTMHDRRAALAATLTAVPFDISAVSAALAEDRRLAGGLADRATALMLDQIARMSAVERADYATALLDHRRNAPSWHDRPGARP